MEDTTPRWWERNGPVLAAILTALAAVIGSLAALVVALQGCSGV